MENSEKTTSDTPTAGRYAQAFAATIIAVVAVFFCLGFIGWMIKAWQFLLNDPRLLIISIVIAIVVWYSVFRYIYQLAVARRKVTAGLSRLNQFIKDKKDEAKNSGSKSDSTPSDSGHGG